MKSCLTSHTWVAPLRAHHRVPDVQRPHSEQRAVRPSTARFEGCRRETRLGFVAVATVLAARSRRPARASLVARSSRLGREDIPGGDPRGLPTLTEDVCLIPGDQPIVRVEDAPGNARRIFTGVDIRASVEEVWQVMTDYEALESRVPNLVQNRVLERYPDGGARLWQVGRASWRILNKNFFFQAGTTLDVHLHPEGCPEDAIVEIDLEGTNEEVRAVDADTPLRRGIFPRPFSVSAEGHRDITFENVVEARGDFVHYRGMWRFEQLEGCALPGEERMRLTFAVECEPHWFLPVAPVEGRIATAMAENMAVIRDFIEYIKDNPGAVSELGTEASALVPTGKLSDVEWFAEAMSETAKPVSEAVGQPMQMTTLWKEPLEGLADAVPSKALRIFLMRLAVAPNPAAFLAWQTRAGASVSLLLVRKPNLLYTFLVHCPQIIPHLPAIYTRLSVLEPHIPAIIRILDPYLQIVRPELDRIMERMDKIEPHLPYILLHLDVLAKHCGKLLDHFEQLLPFAYMEPLGQEGDDLRCFRNEHQNEATGAIEVVEWCEVAMTESDPDMEVQVELEQRRRSYLPQLLPYVDLLVPHLDDVSDHLPYIRPHLPYILPYMDAVLPYVSRFKDYPSASKNADVLTAYLGWLFTLPVVPRVLNVPGVPRVVAALSCLLPRWPIRGLLRRRWRRFHQEHFYQAT